MFLGGLRRVRDLEARVAALEATHHMRVERDRRLLRLQLRKGGKALRSDTVWQPLGAVPDDGSVLDADDEDEGLML